MNGVDSQFKLFFRSIQAARVELELSAAYTLIAQTRRRHLAEFPGQTRAGAVR